MQEVNFNHWEKLSPPGLCPHPSPGHRQRGQQALSFLLLLRDKNHFPLIVTQLLSQVIFLLEKKKIQVGGGVVEVMEDA